jgi:ribonuclease HI
MSHPTPHFLLRAECHRLNQPGDWHFVLQSADGRPQIEVEDAEPAIQGERLELLTVIRGLEAIDRPARVTLQTASAYVRRGIKYGLDEWRTNNWHWERHGEMVPVKNGDLWRRLDRALKVHQVNCQLIRSDAIRSDAARPKAPQPAARQPALNKPQAAAVSPSAIAHKSAAHGWRQRITGFRRWRREVAHDIRLRLSQLGAGSLPKAWPE